MSKLKEQFVSENKNGKKVKIAIVGDAMLDEYYQVTASRISPEYPIPVELSRTDIPALVRPGGAANVAYQMSNWNAEVTLYCMIDADACNELEGCNFTIVPVYLGNGVKIARKRRFYDNKFPLRRWDVEPESIGTVSTRDQLFKSVSKCWNESKPDVVILSDYNKGTFNYSRDEEPWLAQKLIRLCREFKIPTIVDPKEGPIEQWQGCNILKLNETEAKYFSGKSDWQKQIDFLHRALTICGPMPGWIARDHRVVITRGREGVVSYNEKKPRNPYWQLDSMDNDDEDNKECVIGAGDCFAAFYAMAFARGFAPEEAISLAYQAGAIYVRQRHNSPVCPSQLLDSKFIDPSELKNRNYKLVFTNGCWDVLHHGHIEILEYARSLGHKLVVAIDTDESVKKLKGPKRPINVLEHRIKVLAALNCVDYVVAFHTDGLYNLIKEIQPDVLVKGGDYKKEDVMGYDLVPNVQIFPIQDDISTTKLTERIKNVL